MAGQHRRLIFAIIGVFLAPCAFGQTPQPFGANQENFQRPFRKGGGGGAGAGEPANSPEFENVRKTLETLTPEQRKRFRENFIRWMNLSPEEKKILREREEMRREVMDEEVEHAIKQSGLTLDPARRQLFAQRYAEERRKLEMQLRKDTEERRQPLVQQLIQRLKQEFTTNSTVVTPAPAPVIPVVPGATTPP